MDTVILLHTISPISQPKSHKLQYSKSAAALLQLQYTVLKQLYYSYQHANIGMCSHTSLSVTDCLQGCCKLSEPASIVTDCCDKLPQLTMLSSLPLPSCK